MSVLFSQATTLLVRHPMCGRLLAPSLMALYGDVEHTGFYEKVAPHLELGGS